MSDTEARDVLAEVIQDGVYEGDRSGLESGDRAHANNVADAGLAALRERGFAVVRTADVKAALGLADVDSRWPSDAMIRLEEAIR